MTALATSAHAGFLVRLVEWFDARVSPVVLLEVRRAMRSKALLGMFGVLLAVGGAAVWRAADDVNTGAEEGLTALVVALVATCVGLIPLQSGLALARDRQEGAGPAVAMTGLAARSLLLGRVLTGLVHVAFVLSALGPFLLVVAAIGKGSTLGLTLAVAVVLVAHPLAMATSLLVSSFTARGGLEALRNAGLGQVMVGLTVLASVVAVVLADNPKELFTRDGRLMASLGLWVCLTLPPALFQFAVERHEHDRARPSRRARGWIVLHVLGLPLLPFALLRGPSDDFVLFGVWLVPAVVLYLAYGLGEPVVDARHGKSLLFPGERHGRWVALACLLVATFGLGLQVEPDGKSLVAAPMLTVQLAGIASLPVALRPVLPSIVWTSFVQRVAVLVTFVLALALPIGGRNGPVPEILLGLSPSVGLVMLADEANWLTRSKWLWLGLVAWVCVTVLAEIVLVGEANRREVVS